MSRWFNRFDLIDVSTPPPCTPIATPTVVDGNLLFRQGGDQLNGGRGIVDLQPVMITVSFCTILMHRRIFRPILLRTDIDIQYTG